MAKSNECYILTRYLYVKREVENSLKQALLKKCEKETLFWAYELYYSGFIEDLLCIIFNIYYEYYYIVNPSFESYLIVKYKLLMNIDELNQPQIIYQIISNLIIRRKNEDVSKLLNMNKNINVDVCVNKKITLTKKFLDTQNDKYDELAKIILNVSVGEREKLMKKYEKIVEYFMLKGMLIKNNIRNVLKELKNVFIEPSIIVLAHIIQHYKEYNKEEMGKSVYINLDEEDEEEEMENFYTYHTQYDEKNDMYRNGWEVLKMVELYGVDCSRGNDCNTKDIYEHWLYYASFSPIWKKRIENYEGKICDVERKVVFENEENMDEFYNRYDLELDEQSSEIKRKIMGC